MKLLITSKNGFFKVHNHSIRQLAPHDHFGLTWDEEWVYAFRRGGKNNTTVQRFSRELTEYTEMFLNSVRTAHQSLYVPGTGNIITVNTSHNELVDWPKEWKANSPVECYNQINYTNFAADHAQDNPTGDKGNHINSIYYDGEFYWTVHHNFDVRETEVVQLSKEFRVLKKFSASKDVMAQAHNCYRIDRDTVITLLSKEGEVVYINFKTGARKTINLRNIVGIDLYLRGLAVTADNVYVGASLPLLRNERKNGQLVYIYEFTRDWEPVAVWSCVGIKELFDLRAIHDTDLAHNGIPF